jgi:hypothetical protein
MGKRNEDSSRRATRGLCIGVTTLGLLVSVPVAVGQELPGFRKGLWEFNRSIDSGSGKPQSVATKQCVNPSDDMKKQNEMLTRAGCTFSPVARSGNAYSFSSQCRIQGVSAQSKSVIHADGDSAYRIEVESQQGQVKTRETLVAKRVGDC